MSNLEVLTDDTVLAKYGIRPQQYADFAVMRGDTSDGLPGVAGVGEKTAAALLAEYGDLAGILTAAADASSGMKPAVRRRFEAAADYLVVAPRVVEVVRDLDLPTPEARLHPPTQQGREALEALAERWNLTSPLNRLLSVLE